MNIPINTIALTESITNLVVKQEELVERSILSAIKNGKRSITIHFPDKFLSSILDELKSKGYRVVELTSYIIVSWN